jgi:peptidyl-prolyl cis-trans isomerase B (cyclophilin B)
LFYALRIVTGLLLFFVSVTAVAEEEKLPFTVPADYKEMPATALLETTQGSFEIEFHRRETPVSVANFEYLGRKGVFNGTEFHRYVPEFVIQGGDPTHTGKGGPGWTLPPEISDRVHHVRGSLGWARLPAEVNPERRSNGSQFYITLNPASNLDGFYTVFATVIRGFDTVQRLREGDKILTVKFPKQSKKQATSTQPWQ